MTTTAQASAQAKAQTQAPGQETQETSQPWHARSIDEVFEAFDTRVEGLSDTEATHRLTVHGPNVLPQTAGRHPIWRFLAQFNNALIYFLLAAAVAALVLGHVVDAFVIVAVVIVNAIVGFVQEGKAEKALTAIRNLIAPRATLMRGGRRTSVAAAELVPGDIVIVEPGDRIPADLRLLRSRALLIDEALLTGESVAAEKRTDPVREDAPLGDRHCMAYFGTLVATGQAMGIVTATGTHTQIGRISALLQSVESLTTPLLRQINQFGRRFTWTAITGAGLLFVFAIALRDYEWPTALIAVVALAVGIVPEGLPAVITITLAIGVQRMAARNAVIRKLPAVETLGATSVICSDKTGTLTRNEMTVRQIATPRHHVEVSGAGYVPEGEFTAPGSDDDAAAVASIMPLVRCGVLCNDAHVHRKEGGWVVEGDPMEGALYALAMKAGLNVEHVRAEWQRLDEIPFDAAYRYMASLHRAPNGEHVIFVKGAPEQIASLARVQATEEGAMPLDSEYWQERIAYAASEGERVLGFASKKLATPQERISHEDLASGLQFLGIAGFIDPPREEVADAIAQCRTAGIQVKMITGDHAATAVAIARQLAIADEPHALTGAQLDSLSDAQLAEAARTTAVFARTSPEHKLRIVRALQSHNAIVAMTGDGVNDAPSLKQADVGVAMGIKGTEAAKEAAAMVLLDDNFASIVNAVHEGRTVYDNIRKVISWTVPTNGGEAMTVIVAILFGFTLPMSAVQILWINLILTATLGLVLAFEPSEPNVMQRPPRSSTASILSPFLVWRIALTSVLFLLASLGVFFYSLNRGDDLEMARTLVVNQLIVLEIFYLFNVRYLHVRSMTWRGVQGTPAVLLAIAAVVLAQLAFNYVPTMNQLFDSRPVALLDGVLVVAIGAALLVFLECEKFVMRRLRIFEELVA
jgi:magnesium-transporting ATPase (P-type)